MENKLTSKASTVLNILLNSETSLTASQIIELDPELNVNTVQNVLRTLLKSEYIEIADIVYSGTVLCRSYRATEKAQNDSVKRLAEQFGILRKAVSAKVIFSALIDDDSCNEDMIAELEEMLAEKKRD